jgi:hypothetical protein
MISLTKNVLGGHLQKKIMVGKRSKSLREYLRDHSYKKRSASLTSVNALRRIRNYIVINIITRPLVLSSIPICLSIKEVSFLFET